MVSHCRSGLPEEACGIFAGRGNTAERIYPVMNVEKSPVSYLMEPGAQLQIFREIRNSRMDMVAVYHSHPSSRAYPSNKDISLAFYPDCAYVIVGLANAEHPEIRAFHIVEGAVGNVDIVALSPEVDAEKGY